MPHTEFLTALEKKDSKSLKKLIRENQRILHFLDAQGNALVHYAIDWGNKDFLIFLLEQGAEPCLANLLNEEPLHVALQQANAKEFLTLLGEALRKKLYKTHIYTQVADGNLFLQNLEDTESQIPINKANWEEVSLHPLNLHELILRGDLKESDIEQLLGPQALSHWVDNANYTPLHLAAALGDESAVQMLMRNLTLDWLYARNVRGQTPLLLAAKHGHSAVIKCLLNENWGSECQKKQLDIADYLGNHIFHYLAIGNTSNHVEIYKSLSDRNKESIYSCYLKLVPLPNRAGTLASSLGTFLRINRKARKARKIKKDEYQANPQSAADPFSSPPSLPSPPVDSHAVPMPLTVSSYDSSAKKLIREVGDNGDILDAIEIGIPYSSNTNMSINNSSPHAANPAYRAEKEEALIYTENSALLANTPSSSDNETDIDILERYRNPGIMGEAIRRWIYSISLQNFIARTSNLCCSNGCCSRCQSKTQVQLIDQVTQEKKIKKRSSWKVLAPLSDANPPSIFQSRFAPFAYFADPVTQRIAHFTEGFIDHFNWTLEKGWLMVLSAFIYKGLYDYFRMPGWQRQRTDILNLLVAKTVEERLASYVSNGTIYGTLLSAAGFMGLIAGGTKAYHQGRRYQPHELEELKMQVLYQTHHPIINGLHEALEILEIPAVISLLVLAPPVVFFLLLFKLKHLFKPGALHDLKYAVLWDTGLTIEQRVQLFDVLMRACRTQYDFGQMEAVSALADIVYHLNLEQLDTLRDQLKDPEFFKDEQGSTIEILYNMKRRGLQALAKLANTAPQHGYVLWLGRYHPRVINARFHYWRLGMARNLQAHSSMLPLYLYSRIPRLVSSGLFIYTIINGLVEKFEREHEAEKCDKAGLQWRYVVSVAEYLCSLCPNLQIPYRYMQTNDLCIQGFLNDSRTLEQWNTTLNVLKLNFANFSTIDLSGQTQVIQQGQLPTLLGWLAAKSQNVTTLIINNKLDEPYTLSTEDLLAIGNFTRAFANFDALGLEYQRLGVVLNGTQLGQFAGSLHSDLNRLILSHNQLGAVNTSLFFANLPRKLNYLELEYNDLSDRDGQALAQVLLTLPELNGLYLSNNPQITDQSGTALVSYLAKHENLIIWDLSATSVGDNTAIQFNNASRNPATNASLFIDMSNCPQLSDIGGVSFAQSLKNNAPFAFLVITDNPRLTETTLQAVTDALPYAQPLLAFGVGSPHFTNLGGVVNYINALQAQTDLLALDLSSVPLTKASSVTELATTLHKLPNLLSLILVNTQLTDTSFKQLLPALKRSAIEALTLSQNLNLTDASIQALIAEPPVNLKYLFLSNNNFTLASAESLGQLLHKVPLVELELAHNPLGLQFMSRFAPYLRSSPLQVLGLSNCSLADQAIRDLAEELTEDGVPDTWLSSLDSATIRSLAKGNPGTNLSFIDVSFNEVSDIGAERLCQVLPGTDVSVNHLILQGNPINATLLRDCGDIGLNSLDSPGNHLTPGGPYVWLWRQLQAWYANQAKAKEPALPQHFPTTHTMGTKVKAVLAHQLVDLNLGVKELQNCRNANFGQASLSVAVIPDLNRDRELHVLDTSCEKIAQAFRTQHQVAEQNPFSSIGVTAYNTAWSLLSGAGYAIGLTTVPTIGATVLRQMGVAEERARIWVENLQQLFSLALMIWRSPSYALATFVLGVSIYRLCPDRNTASFLQLMATILLLTVSELWQGSSNLENAALQMVSSSLGTIGGQVVVRSVSSQAKSMWQSYGGWWKPAQKFQEDVSTEDCVQSSSQNKPLGFTRG